MRQSTMRRFRMRPGFILSRVAASLASVAAFAVVAAIPAHPNPSGQGQRIHWVPTPIAQLKIDGKIPIKWNVFWPEKTDKRKGPAVVLILLGRRYIALDIKSRLAYSVLPTDLEAHGENFESNDLAVPDREIPSSDWTVRDVGPAELIRLTLDDYGRQIEVQLPHPPDLRWAY
jgi:hypothetical protein